MYTLFRIVINKLAFLKLYDNCIINRLFYCYAIQLLNGFKNGIVCRFFILLKLNASPDVLAKHYCAQNPTVIEPGVTVNEKRYSRIIEAFYTVMGRIRVFSVLYFGILPSPCDFERQFFRF